MGVACSVRGAVVDRAENVPRNPEEPQTIPTSDSVAASSALTSRCGKECPLEISPVGLSSPSLFSDVGTSLAPWYTYPATLSPYKFDACLAVWKKAESSQFTSSQITNSQSSSTGVQSESPLFSHEHSLLCFYKSFKDFLQSQEVYKTKKQIKAQARLQTKMPVPIHKNDFQAAIGKRCDQENCSKEVEKRAHPHKISASKFFQAVKARARSHSLAIVNTSTETNSVRLSRPVYWKSHTSSSFRSVTTNATLEKSFSGLQDHAMHISSQSDENTERRTPRKIVVVALSSMDRITLCNQLHRNLVFSATREKSPAKVRNRGQPHLFSSPSLRESKSSRTRTNTIQRSTKSRDYEQGSQNSSRRSRRLVSLSTALSPPAPEIPKRIDSHEFVEAVRSRLLHLNEEDGCIRFGGQSLSRSGKKISCQGNLHQNAHTLRKDHTEEQNIDANEEDMSTSDAQEYTSPRQTLDLDPREYPDGDVLKRTIQEEEQLAGEQLYHLVNSLLVTILPHVRKMTDTEVTVCSNCSDLVRDVRKLVVEQTLPTVWGRNWSTLISKTTDTESISFVHNESRSTIQANANDTNPCYRRYPRIVDQTNGTLKVSTMASEKKPAFFLMQNWVAILSAILHTMEETSMKKLDAFQLRSWYDLFSWWSELVWDVLQNPPQETNTTEVPALCEQADVDSNGSQNQFLQTNSNLKVSSTKHGLGNFSAKQLNLPKTPQSTPKNLHKKTQEPRSSYFDSSKSATLGVNFFFSQVSRDSFSDSEESECPSFTRGMAPPPSPRPSTSFKLPPISSPGSAKLASPLVPKQSDSLRKKYIDANQVKEDQKDSQTFQQASVPKLLEHKLF